MKVVKKMSLLISVCSLLLVTSTSLAQVRGDNTKVNARDQRESQLTPDQQPMSGPDAQITRQIRQSLMADKKLSTYAHNVKIITLNGNVTLKGPVRSASEEQMILKCARSADGVAKVADQMEVVSVRQ